jgi:hypothetical protein
MIHLSLDYLPYADKSGIAGASIGGFYTPPAWVRLSNRARMSSFDGLWQITGRVLAWVTLLLAAGFGAS